MVKEDGRLGGNNRNTIAIGAILLKSKGDCVSPLLRTLPWLLISLRVKAKALELTCSSDLLLQHSSLTHPAPAHCVLSVPGTCQDSLTLGLYSEMLSVQTSLWLTKSLFSYLRLNAIFFVKPCSDPLCKGTVFCLWSLRSISGTSY